MQLQKSLSARGARAASARRVVVVKAVAAPEAIKTLNTTRSDQVRRPFPFGLVFVRQTLAWRSVRDVLSSSSRPPCVFRGAFRRGARVALA